MTQLNTLSKNINFLAQNSPQLWTLLQDLKAKLIKIYGDRLFSLILYGSHVRNEATPESDIDIMLVLNDPVNITEEREKIAHLIWYFLTEYDELLSLMPMSRDRFTKSEISFLRVVQREGIEL